MTAKLSLVPPEPTCAERLLAAMAERERLRGLIAELDAAIVADVREYSYARGFRVPLRPEQARRQILAEGENG